MITGLDHVQLAMPKGAEDKARRFFVDILGFEEVGKPEALQARGGCWFKQQDAVLHLGVEDPFTPARKAHPAFRVSDIDALRAKLESHEIKITEDTSLPHVKRFFIADPFGNRIEFVREGDAY